MHPAPRSTPMRRGVPPALTPYSYLATHAREWEVLDLNGERVATIIGPESMALDLCIALNRRHRCAERIARVRAERAMGAL